MAKEVLLNAKMRRTGICGATESLLIDFDAVDKFLPELIETLITAGCEIRGDEIVQKFDSRITPASEEDWTTEYLDATLSIKTVKDVSEAIEHINRYGSHHTDAIIAEDIEAATVFLNRCNRASQRFDAVCRRRRIRNGRRNRHFNRTASRPRTGRNRTIDNLQISSARKRSNPPRLVR